MIEYDYEYDYEYSNDKKLTDAKEDFVVFLKQVFEAETA